MDGIFLELMAQVISAFSPAYLEQPVLLIKNWWWLIPPFILWQPFSYLWLFWRRENWLKLSFHPILLEIKMPKEAPKSIRAMENVFSELWQAFWEPPNFWEKWWDGQLSLGFQLEVASFGGDVHFYIRCPKPRKEIVEAAVYSQYPEVELTLAEDYVRQLPADIPNKEWDFWGADYKLLKDSPYPIKTYRDFEPSEPTFEVKRVDPVSLLFEAMSKVKPGEQLWFQIEASPMAQELADSFIKEGHKLKDKLAKRPEKAKPKSFLTEIADILPTAVREFMQIIVLGHPLDEEKKSKPEESLFPPEMRLTPGEKEILEGVERKISKPPFSCSIRFIFLGKRDVWEKAKLRMMFAYFGSYVTLNTNALIPLGQTITKVYSRPPYRVADSNRLYLRKRRMLRQYKERNSPTFPLAGSNATGSFVLNSEELASLFHFPGWEVAPTPSIPRVEAKKGGPPPNLPVE